MKRVGSRLPALLLVVAAVACGGGDGTPPVSVAPTVTISGGSAQSLSSGATVQLTATVTDKAGRVVVSPSVVWTSTNAAVATVSPAGLVTALLVGSATVTAASIGVSGSVTITVTPGPPARMTIQSQPSGAAAGAPLTGQPVLELRDAAGNLAAATNVVASLASGGGTLSGATVTSTAGIASYTALAVSGLVGPRLLAFTATAGTAPAANSESFVLQPGAAATVALRTPPSGGGLNNAFTTQPVAEIRDGSGNIVTSSSAIVTAAVTFGGGVLSGAIAAASQGVATFSGFTITGSVGQRTLSFGSGALTPATVSVVPCDVTRPPLVGIQATYARTAFAGTLAATDSLAIGERNGSCVAPTGLTVSVTFPGTSGWLAANIVTAGGRGLLSVRTTPGTLSSGTYGATATVSSTNAGSAALAVTFTLRPVYTLSFGDATQKVNVLDPLATLRLPAIVRDTANVVVTAAVAYASRSPSIVTVAADGLLSAKAGGFGWVIGTAVGIGDPTDSVLVTVTGGPGPLLRTDLQRLTYTTGENMSVLVQLDTRGAAVGATSVVFAWPSNSDFPGMLRLTQVVPGTVGAPVVTTDVATGTARISAGSATPMTGLVTLARFDFSATTIGSGQFVTRFVELVAPDQSSLLANASALQYPVVVK